MVEKFYRKILPKNGRKFLFYQKSYIQKNKILSIKLYQKISDKGNLILFFVFHPKGGTSNTDIYLFQVDLFIINDKKSHNQNDYIVSITNNKPIIGFYKGFQHFLIIT